MMRIVTIPCRPTNVVFLAPGGGGGGPGRSEHVEALLERPEVGAVENRACEVDHAGDDLRWGAGPHAAEQDAAAVEVHARPKFLET